MNVAGADFIEPKIGSSSQAHQSSQGYPVFTPQYAKYYEEFLIGNGTILAKNNESDNSLEALGNDDCMIRLTLEDGSGIQGLEAKADSLHIRAAEAAANVNRMPAVERKRVGRGSSPNHHVQPTITHRISAAGHGFPSYQRQPNAQHHHARNILNGVDIDQGVAAVPEEGSSSSVVPAVNGKSRNVQDYVPHRNNKCMELLCDACLPGNSSKVTIVPLADSRVDYVDVLPKDKDSKDSSSSSNSESLRMRSGMRSWFRSKKRRAAAIHEDQLAAAAEVKNWKEKEVGVSEVVKLKKAIQEMNKRVECLQAYCQMLQQNNGRRRNYCMMRIPAPEDDDEAKKNVVVEEHNIIKRMSCGGGPTRAQFYHAVSEARLGVKQFCRAFLQQQQIHDQERSSSNSNSSSAAAENMETSTTTTTTRVSKNVRYHIEALMNQALYEDFENVKFQRNGTHYILDPRRRRALFYESYMRISQKKMGCDWTELIDKESRGYSESFDVFCDEKMRRVEQALVGSDGRYGYGGWGEELMRSFFVAANRVWLLHLLAFSFDSPAFIFRVASHDTFDSMYMEELAPSHRKPTKYGAKGLVSGSVSAGGAGLEAELLPTPPKISVMVMPGFFLDQSQVIIKCKVLLSRPSSPCTLTSPHY